MSYDPANYMEGVPVKISEKYRPPRKVNLSMSCLHHVNTEVLTTEYNVAVENETLKWLENIKNHKENKIGLREEKIRQYEEQKEKKREERIQQEKFEEEQQKKIQEQSEKKCDVEKADVENEDDNSEEEVKDVDAEDVDKNNEDEKITNNEVCEANANVNFIEENSSDEKHSFPLKTDAPTPFPNNTLITYTYPSNTQAPFLPVISQQLPYPPSVLVPTQCSTQTPHQKSPTKSGYSINFADFEGDASDPFDSVALKSINDMEELAKVLQTSNIKQQKIAPGSNNINFSYQQPGSYMNGGYQYSHYLYNYPQPTIPPNTSLYNQISSYQSKFPSSTTSSVPLVTKNSAIFQQDAYPPTNYSQWNRIPSNSSRTAAGAQNYKSYNYAMPQTALSSNVPVSMDNISSSSVVSGFPVMTPSTQSGTPLASSGIQTLDSGIESVSKRPDLEDFYTRYYSNKKSLSRARSGASTPISCQQASKTTLSSSSSVPDLTAVEDSEVLSIVCGNTFERLNSKGVVGSNISRPRPSSTEGYEGLVTRAFQTSTKPPNAAGQKVRLPDPFTELTEDAQTLVQSMAEMGFPRPRVARAVQKLGTDHKKLLEVLLTLQSFQESGEDEVRSERAFYYFMGEVDRVKEFLQASKTLLDLGFEEERVIECLFKHQNDKERCLEEFIG